MRPINHLKSDLHKELLKDSRIEYLGIRQALSDNSLDERVCGLTISGASLTKNIQSMKNWSADSPGQLAHTKIDDNSYIFWRQNDRLQIVRYVTEAENNDFKVLGSGASGTVYEVMNLWTKKHYALKMQSDYDYDDESMDNSNQSELAIANKLVYASHLTGLCKIIMYGRNYLGTKHHSMQRDDIHYTLLEKLKGRLDDIAVNEKFSVDKKVSIILSGLKMAESLKTKNLRHIDLYYYNIGVNDEDELSVYDLDSVIKLNSDKLKEKYDYTNNPVQIFRQLFHSFFNRKLFRHQPKGMSTWSLYKERVYSHGIDSSLLGDKKLLTKCGDEFSESVEDIIKKVSDNLSAGKYDVYPAQLRNDLTSVIKQTDDRLDQYISDIIKIISTSLVMKMESFNSNSITEKSKMLNEIKKILVHKDGIHAFELLMENDDNYQIVDAFKNKLETIKTEQELLSILNTVCNKPKNNLTKTLRC